MSNFYQTDGDASIWLSISLILVLCSFYILKIFIILKTQGGTAKNFKLDKGTLPTEDYSWDIAGGFKRMEGHLYPYINLVDCKKKCRSTADCNAAFLFPTTDGGLCRMIKEGWPEAVFEEGKEMTMEKEYCE